MWDVKYGSNRRRVTLRREEWGKRKGGKNFEVSKLEGEGGLQNKGSFGRGDVDEEGS